MGCGGSKSDASKSTPKAPPPPSGKPASAPAPAAPAVTAPVKEAVTDEEWVEDPNGNDEFLDREIGGKKVNKAGQEVDMYERSDKRPDENSGFGMFQVEEAGSGD